MFVGVVDESETAVGFLDVLYLCIASKRQNHVQVDVFLVREEGGYWVVGVHHEQTRQSRADVSLVARPHS